MRAEIVATHAGETISAGPRASGAWGSAGCRCGGVCAVVEIASCGAAPCSVERAEIGGGVAGGTSGGIGASVAVIQARLASHAGCVPVPPHITDIIAQLL